MLSAEWWSLIRNYRIRVESHLYPLSHVRKDSGCSCGDCEFSSDTAFLPRCKEAHSLDILQIGSTSFHHHR